MKVVGDNHLNGEGRALELPRQNMSCHGMERHGPSAAKCGWAFNNHLGKGGPKDPFQCLMTTNNLTPRWLCTLLRWVKNGCPAHWLMANEGQNIRSELDLLLDITCTDSQGHNCQKIKCLAPLCVHYTFQYLRKLNLVENRDFIMLVVKSTIFHLGPSCIAKRKPGWWSDIQQYLLYTWMWFD